MISTFKNLGGELSLGKLGQYLKKNNEKAKSQQPKSC